MDTGRILKEVEAEIAKLESVARVLRGIDGLASPVKRGRGSFTMSAAARRKISLAQKARWAKQKGKAKA
jgi:hypothetical protein